MGQPWHFMCFAALWRSIPSLLSVLLADQAVKSCQRDLRRHLSHRSRGSVDGEGGGGSLWSCGVRGGSALRTPSGILS